MSVNETVGNAAARDEEQAVQPKTNWSLTDAFALANTLANHGWTRDANADAASSCIYALCRLLKDGGNAAAMREAALPWIAFAEWLLENAGKDALGAAIRDNGPIIRQRLEELRAALAKPPRNCDVFGTKDATREAFQKLRRHRVFADVSLWDSRDEIEAFLDWSFATATEQKGETDAK